MTITQLRSFVEVYRQQSVSKAARELGLTQPAVSGHIASLEAQIERKLFTRHPRGVRPTVIADELASRVSEALDLAENALAEAKARSGTLSGSIHFCGPSDILSDLIARHVQRLTEENLSVHLHPVSTVNEAKAMLIEGRSDFAFALPEPDDDRIDSAVFGREKLMLVASPAVAAAMRKTSDLAEALRTTPFVAYDLQRGLIREWVQHNNIPIEQAHEIITAPDLRGLRNFVLNGAGWGVLPGYLVAEEIKDGRLKAIKGPKGDPVSEYRMLWLKSAMRSPRTARARRLLLDES